MTEGTDSPVLARVSVDATTYEMYLTSPEHDYIQKTIAESGAPYEASMLKDLAGRLSAGSVVLDVGANIGNHTFYLANTVDCKVLSFEPNSDLVAAMRKTIEHGSLQNRVNVYDFALGDCEASAHFQDFKPDNLGAQALQVGEGNIQVRTLDSIQGIERVDAVKVDVEGMELNVLKGGRNLLEKFTPLLYVECISFERFRDVLDFVAELGYEYLETFNATPTHLFLHQESINGLDLQLRLQRVEVLYASRENATLSKQLVDCQNKYREITLANGTLRDDLNDMSQSLHVVEAALLKTTAKLKKSKRAHKKVSEAYDNVNKRLEGLLAATEGDAEQLVPSQGFANNKHLEESLAQVRNDLAQSKLEKLQHARELSDAKCELQRLNDELEEKSKRARDLESREDLHKNRIFELDQKYRRTLRDAKEIFVQEREENLIFIRDLASRRQDALAPMNAYHDQLSRISEYKSGIEKLSAERVDLVPDVLQDNTRLGELRSKYKNLKQFTQQLTVFNKLRKADSQGSHHTKKEKVKVATIMDDFTYHSYKEECDLMQLSLTNYKEELENFQPNLLFIESAWRGKDEEWGNRIAHRATEVVEIISWCKERNIPTVFWNKEDPVHFETFLNVAKLIDHVFTTDIDCISRYKASLGHSNVHFLPFACQPAVHNPIEKYERKNAFCFAGAYYVRYPERTKDLETFVKELPVHAGFEIYDRNYGKDNPDYMFPEDYKRYIVGTLSFSEIDRAYKGYKYAINLNSIKHSQTMFARRVYELLASNTITVSNYSRGVRLMFGDLVVTTDSGQQAVRKLEVIDQDDVTSRRFRLLGLRKVLTQHTYEHRFEYIKSKAFAQPVQNHDPHVSVIGAAHSEIEIQLVVESFRRQTYTKKSLTVVHDFTPNHSCFDDDIRYISQTEFCDEMGQTDELHQWMAYFAAQDHYGENYLQDLVLGTRYSPSDIIGKVAYYRAVENHLVLESQEKAYTFHDRFYARSSMFRAHHLISALTEQFVDYASELEFSTESGLAVDEFNYAYNAAGFSPEALETVDDLKGAHPGWSLSSLTSAADSMEASVSDIIAEGGSIPGSEFFQLFGRPSEKIQFAIDGSVWLVTSTLQDGKHEYCYAKRELTLEESGLDKTSKFHLESTPGLNVQIVIVYLNQKKEKISHEIKYANKNVILNIPENTRFIRYGMRFYAAGSCQIERLIIGHKQLNPGSVFSSAQHLVLTNHYPSYSDLYRNGFVHSRVKAYREQGVSVDVFRLRIDESISYHEFDGIDVITGSLEALDKALGSGRYKSVLVHFLSAEMWNVLKRHLDHVRINIWVHGAEIQPWWRRKYLHSTSSQLDEAKNQSALRVAFWDAVLATRHENIRLVFVSRAFAREVSQDYGIDLGDLNHEIVHNYINEKDFPYRKKDIDFRRKILSIRPYATTTYANDLTVKAILELSSRDCFSKLEFCLVGDGVLFDELTRPLNQFENVKLCKAFLTHTEIAEYHQKYGVFLTPSRMDTQGVSRDEAMSSGLVPVTTRVGAIPEFVDNECGRVVEPEDYVGLADAIEELYHSPELFTRLSEAAATRVRQQSGFASTVKKELALFT